MYIAGRIKADNPKKITSSEPFNDIDSLYLYVKRVFEVENGAGNFPFTKEAFAVDLKKQGYAQLPLKETGIVFGEKEKLRELKYIF